MRVLPRRCTRAQGSGDDDCGRRSKGAGRLEIRFADRTAIAPTASQIATRTIARVEFDLIAARGDGADNDLERAVAAKIGCDDAHFHRCHRRGHALPGDLAATAGSWVRRKLAEGPRSRGAEDVNANLVELNGRRADQRKGDRQFALRRRYRSLDIAVGQVKRFAEIIPTDGSFLCRLRGRRADGQKQCRHQQNCFFHIASPSVWKNGLEK